jgi:hypothetical protein
VFKAQGELADFLDMDRIFGNLERVPGGRGDEDEDDSDHDNVVAAGGFDDFVMRVDRPPFAAGVYPRGNAEGVLYVRNERLLLNAIPIHGVRSDGDGVVVLLLVAVCVCVYVCVYVCVCVCM